MFWLKVLNEAIPERQCSFIRQQRLSKTSKLQHTINKNHQSWSSTWETVHGAKWEIDVVSATTLRPHQSKGITINNRAGESYLGTLERPPTRGWQNRESSACFPSECWVLSHAACSTDTLGCILQRNTICPRCSCFLSHTPLVLDSWVSVLKSLSLSLCSTDDAQYSGIQSSWRLTERKSQGKLAPHAGSHLTLLIIQHTQGHTLSGGRTHCSAGIGGSQCQSSENPVQPPTNPLLFLLIGSLLYFSLSPFYFSVDRIRAGFKMTTQD